MQPRIETLSQKKLAGKRLKMSFAEDKTFVLWQSFMPHLRKIRNAIGSNLYSVEVFDPSFFDPFDPFKEFEKWAAVEVSSFESVPVGMETLLLPSGLYAVFVHKGPSSEGRKTYDFIFRIWLPGSEFRLDARPHFAVMGENYKQNDPDSEEEIWIPIKQTIE